MGNYISKHISLQQKVCHLDFETFINLLNIQEVIFTCNIDQNNSAVELLEITFKSGDFFDLIVKRSSLFFMRVTESIKNLILFRLNGSLDVKRIEYLGSEVRYYSISQFAKVFNGCKIQRQESLEEKHPFKPIYIIYQENDLEENSEIWRLTNLQEEVLLPFSMTIEKTDSEIEHERDRNERLQEERDDHGNSFYKDSDNSWMDSPSDHWNID